MLRRVPSRLINRLTSVRWPNRSSSRRPRGVALAPHLERTLCSPPPDEEPKKPKLDRGVLGQAAALTGSQFALSFGMACVYPVLSPYAAELGLTTTEIAAMVAAPALSRIMCNLWMGRKADSVGRKPVMMCGQLTIASLSVALATAGSMGSLIAIRFLTGVGTSASSAGASAYMADMTETVRNYRGTIIGVYQDGIALAYTLGPFIGGQVAMAYGPAATFLVAAGASVAATALTVFLPETMTSEMKEMALEGEKQNLSLKEVCLPLIRSPDMQGIFALNFALSMSFSILTMILPLHAMSTGASHAEIGTLLAINSGIGLIGNPVGGFLADRIGRKKVVIPGTLFIVAGCGSLALFDSHSDMLFSVALWGLGNSLIIPSLTAFSNDVSPKGQRGTALSLARQPQDIAFFVSPLLFGLLAEVTSTGVALCSSALLIGSAGLFFSMKATEPAKAAQ